MASDKKKDVPVSQHPMGDVPEASQKMPFLGSLDEVERMFERLIPRTWMRQMNWNWPMWGGMGENMGSLRVPQLDVIDRDSEILVRAELPGVRKEDIHVSTTDNSLGIWASVRREQTEERKDYVRSEISQGNFSRSLPIPAGIDLENIRAAFKDGILEIVLPKSEGAQRRSIDVN